mgnify:CR=1 FL=1
MLTFAQAIAGSPAPGNVLNDLKLLNVDYFGFDEAVHTGQILVHRSLAKDLQNIFAALVQLKFPIEKIVPIVAYEWVDIPSMLENNTSAFNYRLIAQSDRLSNHSLGRAIDINPLVNPYIGPTRTSPPGATYDPTAKGAIVADGPVVQLFETAGWEWGGRWLDRKDYQHFQKINS